MLKSYLCDYSDVHILVKGTVVGTGGTVVVVQADRNNKVYVPFTGCIIEMRSTQVNNGNDLRVVMSMYNLQNIVIIICKRI